MAEEYPIWDEDDEEWGEEELRLWEAWIEAEREVREKRRLAEQKRQAEVMRVEIPRPRVLEPPFEEVPVERAPSPVAEALEKTAQQELEELLRAKAALPGIIPPRIALKKEEEEEED